MVSRQVSQSSRSSPGTRDEAAVLHTFAKEVSMRKCLDFEKKRRNSPSRAQLLKRGEPHKTFCINSGPTLNFRGCAKIQVTSRARLRQLAVDLTYVLNIAKMAEPTAGSTAQLREVQIEAVVVMRIIKHSTSTFPTPATGCLVGMDVAAAPGTQLQITNCFPFPPAVPDQQQQDSYYQTDPAALAASAPRAKSNVTYQNEMIKNLKEVNVDAQSVGWYISTSMGNFVNQNFVENQSFYQRAADEKTVALVFDMGKSSAGSLSIKAYRLSPGFIAAYREAKFTTERYVFDSILTT